MKCLIIYDSQFGNTEKIALAVESALKQRSQLLCKRAADAAAGDLDGVDLLIAGSPTYGGRASQPMQAFLDRLPPGSLQGMRAATFDTSMTPVGQGFVVRKVIKIFGSAAPRLAMALIAKGAMSADAETFYVLGREGPLQAGEEERAAAWASKLLVKNE